MKNPSAIFPQAILLTALVLAVATLQPAAVATTIMIDPTDDGVAYPGGETITYQYLQAGPIERGIVEFSAQDIGDVILDGRLSVNPYALSLGAPVLTVYGYESYDGRVSASDYDAGTFLGYWTMPDIPHYGEDIFFDVTAFLRQVSSPYIGFCLRAPLDVLGPDQFSSLEYNYGHSAQLIVTSVEAPVPEPATWVLFLAGLSIAGAIRSRRTHRLD